MKMKKHMSVQLTEEQKKKILPFLRQGAQARLNLEYAVYGIGYVLSGDNPEFDNKEWDDMQKRFWCFAEEAISGESDHVHVGLKDVQPYINSCKTLRRFHAQEEQEDGLSAAAKAKIAQAQRARWKKIKGAT